MENWAGGSQLALSSEELFLETRNKQPGATWETLDGGRDKGHLAKDANALPASLSRTRMSAMRLLCPQWLPQPDHWPLAALGDSIPGTAVGKSTALKRR